MEDRIEFRASDTESDKVELRRRLEMLVEPSANVAARDGSRRRRPGKLLSVLSLLLLLLLVKEDRGEGDEGRG